MGWPITIESCSWIDFISVAYARWYHWTCGRTQLKAATINQLACPSYSLYVQLLWYSMYYPEGMKARVSPVQWSKPHSILPLLRIRTRAAGFRIISGDHYITTVHKSCKQCKNNWFLICNRLPTGVVCRAGVIDQQGPVSGRMLAPVEDGHERPVLQVSSFEVVLPTWEQRALRAVRRDQMNLEISAMTEM